jgi:hypothetical protein
MEQRNSPSMTPTKQSPFQKTNSPTVAYISSARNEFRICHLFRWHRSVFKLWREARLQQSMERDNHVMYVSRAGRFGEQVIFRPTGSEERRTHTLQPRFAVTIDRLAEEAARPTHRQQWRKENQHSRPHCHPGRWAR